MTSTEEFYRVVKAIIEENVEALKGKWDSNLSLWLDWVLRALDEE